MRLLPLLVTACLASFSACAGTADPSRNLFPALEQAEIESETASGKFKFAVWIAADDESRARGLMFVRQLPADHGMLFVFEFPQELAFWMKDTYLSLDLVFIGPEGQVVNIAHGTRPLSLEPIESRGMAIAVLEVTAGTARRIGLAPGDRIRIPGLRTTWDSAGEPERPTSVPRAPN